MVSFLEKEKIYRENTHALKNNAKNAYNHFIKKINK